MKQVIASRSLVRVLKLASKLLDEIPDQESESWNDRRQICIDDIEMILKSGEIES